MHWGVDVHDEHVLWCVRIILDTCPALQVSDATAYCCAVAVLGSVPHQATHSSSCSDRAMLGVSSSACHLRLVRVTVVLLVLQTAGLSIPDRLWFLRRLTCAKLAVGLQTGWVTMGSLQSAILGFGIFQVLRRYGWVQDFSIAENVIVQTCAVASATMPLAAGFVGVIPAMMHLTPEENPPDGGYEFSTLQLILWSTTLAFFGVFVAVPLRTQVIEREQLRFPSGTATAQVIKALHEAHGPEEVSGNQAQMGIASCLQSPSRVSYNSHVPCGFRIGSSYCSIEEPYKRTTSDVILSTALSAVLDEEISQVSLMDVSFTWTLFWPQPDPCTRLALAVHAGTNSVRNWNSSVARSRIAFAWACNPGPCSEKRSWWHQCGLYRHHMVGFGVLIHIFICCRRPRGYA